MINPPKQSHESFDKQPHNSCSFAQPLVESNLALTKNSVDIGNSKYPSSTQYDSIFPTPTLIIGDGSKHWVLNMEDLNAYDKCLVECLFFKIWDPGGHHYCKHIEPVPVNEEVESEETPTNDTGKSQMLV
ncbi:hypothetical protein PIB30_059006 [Stylosanthes scabra]|uniref:Uncharacterized protein n=1 Tax=Stylosanthes scabra TaxID=79078 RepID=A0ABU6YJG3_9FABA|nr:hypothetical protein [Stylosanthes scabra]